jgi:hypothetical protein
LLTSSYGYDGQHPHETIARYGYPVMERGLIDTIRQACYLIDLSIGLEEGETKPS